MSGKLAWEDAFVALLGACHLVVGVSVAQSWAPDFLVRVLSEHVSLLWDLVPALRTEDRYEYDPRVIAAFWYQFFGVVLLVCAALIQREKREGPFPQRQWALGLAVVALTAFVCVPNSAFVLTLGSSAGLFVKASER